MHQNQRVLLGLLSGLGWLLLGATAEAQLPPTPTWNRTAPQGRPAARAAQSEVDPTARQRDPRSVLRTAQAPRSATPAAAPQPAVPADKPDLEDRFVQVSFRLRNLAPAELEYQVLKLGARSEIDPSQDVDRFTNFRFKNGAGVSVGIRVDRVGGMVELEGLDSSVRVWRNLIATLDSAPAENSATQVVPVIKASPEKVKQAISLARAVAQSQGNVAAQNVALQGGDPQPGLPDMLPPNAPAEGQPAPGPGNGGPVAVPDDLGTLLGSVQIYYAEGLDAIVVKGRKQDVERVLRLIEEIEKQSIESQPEVDVVPLTNVNNQSLATLLLQIYDQVFSTRQGRATIIPLVKPNAILLIGRKENLDAVRELIVKLDQPTDPNAELRVFSLKNIAAAQAEQTIRNFFVARPGAGNDDERLGLGTKVLIVSDFRSNALIVQAAPRDMQEVVKMLKTLDADGNAAKNEVRIIRLKNALAQDLAPVLQQAISGQGTTGGNLNLNPNAGPQAGGNTNANQPRSTSLEFLAIDGQQSRLLESGILSDMSVVADPRGNALIVTGPARGMELMQALISQLDSLPVAEAQLKVFTIVNGDATSLATLLQQLFGQTTNQGGGGGGFGGGGFGGGANQLPLQTATGAGETTLVPLRFSVDARTNSIVASGTAGDLQVVYQILLRLDEGDVRDRVTTVYRLQNAPASDVSLAINQWLQGRRQLNQLETQITSPFEQIEREVIVVPEVVSNSLIVSATPRYFEEVRKIVTDLDRRPPMVVIQVCIAEVTLGNVDEFGVELGIQDSLLFTRGINSVGFPFIGQPLGNDQTAGSLSTREDLAGQAVGSFGVGRTNTTLGYGGLVLSASNESVNILIRALQDSRRMEVISRPQVQTLDNQPAFVQVGARVPRISSTQVVNNSQINSTVLENVGILLGVTPRTSPDGLIVMEINAEKSQLGPIDQGIPISINANGDVIRSPQINITTAQTTVSARTGQTVILGGLITTSENEITRRVPYLADIPVVGRLFRFDSVTKNRTELLIIMTPFIVRTDDDIEWMNQRESERMSWCLADIVNVHGEVSMGSSSMSRNDGTSPLIFPDSQGYSAPTEALPPTDAASNSLMGSGTGTNPQGPVGVTPYGTLPEPLNFPPPKAPLPHSPFGPTPAQPMPTQPLQSQPQPSQPMLEQPMQQTPSPLQPMMNPPNDAGDSPPVPPPVPQGMQGRVNPVQQPYAPAAIVPAQPPLEIAPANPQLQPSVAPAGYMQPYIMPNGYGQSAVAPAGFAQPVVTTPPLGPAPGVPANAPPRVQAAAAPPPAKANRSWWQWPATK